MPPTHAHPTEALISWLLTSTLPKCPKILHSMSIHGYFLQLHNKKILIAQTTWLEGLANLPLTLFCHIMWIAHLYRYMGSVRRHQKTINLPFLTTVFPFWTDTAAKRRCQRTWRGEWQSVAWWHMHHTEPAFYSELPHCAAATFYQQMDQLPWKECTTSGPHG